MNLSHSCSDSKGFQIRPFEGKKMSSSHLVGSFSPSFGRITQCPMALLGISMQKTTCCVSLVPFLCCFSLYIFRFLPPQAFVFFPPTSAISLAHICPPVVLYHLERLGLSLFLRHPPASCFTPCFTSSLCPSACCQNSVHQSQTLSF